MKVISDRCPCWDKVDHKALWCNCACSCHQNPLNYAMFMRMAKLMVGEKHLS